MWLHSLANWTELDPEVEERVFHSVTVDVNREIKATWCHYNKKKWLDTIQDINLFYWNYQSFTNFLYKKHAVPKKFKNKLISPTSEASREVANLMERKNSHAPVYGVKEFVCLSVGLWWTLTPIISGLAKEKGIKN